MGMNSRQRILIALRRQPDRVPVLIFLDPYADTWAVADHRSFRLQFGLAARGRNDCPGGVREQSGRSATLPERLGSAR